MSAILRKDTSIWVLVARLAITFGGDAFQLIDHWDADLFAVGITNAKDERRLVYISTFRKPPGQFAYDCEEPDALGEPRSVAHSDAADFREIVAVLARHLAIKPDHDAS